MKWKTDLIHNTFQEEIAQKILQIPLAETVNEDGQVWKGEQSGEYSVCSAYKLLQDSTLDPSRNLIQADGKKFYRKLWNLHLPTKITITIWRISWNYLPTMANLKSRRVVAHCRCPRCCYEVEDCHHIFRKCLASIEVWQYLDISWVTNNSSADFWEWLT
ncbi:hypothetical protein J1N35_043486 [Gossypium stocksii]|uniref:Reverse transcriptase zinc-binding domain-containing protein n=1 Tax=Gossypium stocksii TaxID=47602 RepID=A0A9D3ZEY8_9ROSI|nr:hypothetical protein J1N35_043486 [Gossypium stocksii]